MRQTEFIFVRTDPSEPRKFSTLSPLVLVTEIKKKSIVSVIWFYSVSLRLFDPHMGNDVCL
jgi:hypothetical protein